jgi:hypothetical protein
MPEHRGFWGKGGVAEVLSPGIAHTPTLCYNIVANLMFKWGGVGIGPSAYALLLEVVYDTISLQN